jgi:DNA-binding MarR family transcriptional regulator
VSNPRLSIIPAGAVTDPRLKPRDLQVLCLLGRHIDRAGWCMRSQVRMAAEIRCSRGSLQNSLDRLCEAGWIERRRRDVEVAEAGGHPSRSYAYRVLLDRDDEAFETLPDEPNEGEISSYAENASEEGGCQPVGTPANGLARGANPMVGTGANPCIGTKNVPLERPLTERDDRANARARGESFTEGSRALAATFWRALGFEGPRDIPPEFAGIDYRAVMWEQAGWTPDLIDAEARKIARDRPLKPISYFEKVFATAFAKREAPLPVAEIRQPERLTVTPNGRPAGNNLIQAADRLIDRIKSFDARPGSADGLCGGTGAAATRLLPKE